MFASIFTSYGGLDSNIRQARTASSDRHHGRWGVKRRTRHTLILLSVPTLLLLALGDAFDNAAAESPASNSPPTMLAITALADTLTGYINQGVER